VWQKVIVRRSQRHPNEPDAPEAPVSETFSNYLLELTSVDPARLGDSDGLSALVIAAAGAMGVAALGPPVVRTSREGLAVALLCREGHIVLHSAPSDGICLIDIVARIPAEAVKGIEVISRRLTN
jgi:S-adenosylmethionine/arginine decarboxylase-like enzyme